MSGPYDLLLIGGIVMNPATGIHQPMDVGVVGDRITEIAPSLAQESAKTVLDVQGGYITPGLIDFHVHSYWGVNPYGFNAAQFALPVASRRRWMPDGVLNDPGELGNLKFADPDGAAQSVSDARNVGVGIKVWLHKKAVGDNGREALRMAVRTGEACKAPVMVHIGNTGISIEEIVDTLRPGDYQPGLGALPRSINAV